MYKDRIIRGYFAKKEDGLLQSQQLKVINMERNITGFNGEINVQDKIAKNNVYVQYKIGNDTKINEVKAKLQTTKNGISKYIVKNEDLQVNPTEKITYMYIYKSKDSKVKLFKESNWNGLDPFATKVFTGDFEKKGIHISSVKFNEVKTGNKLIGYTVSGKLVTKDLKTPIIDFYYSFDDESIMTIEDSVLERKLTKNGAVYAFETEMVKLKKDKKTMNIMFAAHAYDGSVLDNVYYADDNNGNFYTLDQTYHDPVVKFNSNDLKVKLNSIESINSKTDRVEICTKSESNKGNAYIFVIGNKIEKVVKAKYIKTSDKESYYSVDFNSADVKGKKLFIAYEEDGVLYLDNNYGIYYKFDDFMGK